jgi:hypothetical protein
VSSAERITGVLHPYVSSAERINRHSTSSGEYCSTQSQTNDSISLCKLSVRTAGVLYPYMTAALRKIACKSISRTALALHKAVETTGCAAGLVALPNANGIRKKYFLSSSYVFKYS